GVTQQFGVDASSTPPRILEAFEDVNASSLGHHDAIAPHVEGAGSVGRIIVFRKGTLTAEAGKDAERANALRHATGKGHIALTQTQHLSSLDEPRVSRRTGGPNRVMGAPDGHVQRNFPGGIIRDGAGIVVMRPIARIVVVALDLVDFVLRLDIAMFRD